MILTPWIDAVGYSIIAESERDVCLSVSTHTVLNAMMMEHFDPKIHQAALLLKFSNSHFVLFLEHPNDLPRNNVYDPTTGKVLIKFESRQEYDSSGCSAAMRLDEKENE